MKCSGCKYYMRSKVFGNGCSCKGVKPCDKERRAKRRKHHDDSNRKRGEKYRQ